MWLRRLQNLGFAQICSFVSHLWTLFISRVKTLLHTFHPYHKLAHILLVTGPLRQGALQLTNDFKEYSKVRLCRTWHGKYSCSWQVDAVSTFLFWVWKKLCGSYQNAVWKTWLDVVNFPWEHTFCIGLRQRGGHPRNLSGPEFVSGLQALPQLRCFSELTLLLWSTSSAGSPSPDELLARPDGEITRAFIRLW